MSGVNGYCCFTRTFNDCYSITRVTIFATRMILVESRQAR